jgi:dGTPase
MATGGENSRWDADRPAADPDTHRLVREAAKDTTPGTDTRGPFERDRARVLHCAAFRRLAAKTQVRTAGHDQFIRTRLTHSLEVAQVARELGARLGCDPDVTDTAGLAHDLGHPPYGHNGEETLDALAESCGGFEGNAQTLRVLTRLEAKVHAADGTSVGLNLTRASLDAVTKYPWPRRDGLRKFGVYSDDLPVYRWLRRDAPDGRRCLEAQVMDWADDVAYSVHDVEDGIHAHLVTMGGLRRDSQERAALCADAVEHYSGETAEDLETILVDLLADPLFAPLDSYEGNQRDQIALKRLTSVLTGRFVAAAATATRDEYGPGQLRRYAADLVVPRLVRAQCALLKGIALRYVMRRTGAEARYEKERELLSQLVAVLADRAPEALDPMFVPLWERAPDDAARLRVVIDQVASLTDPGAEAWHRQLAG